MAYFSLVIPLLKKVEGGIVNDTSDSGGLTNTGISQTAYPNLNIRALTQEQILKIYEKDFWNFYRLSEINDQETANTLFLATINMNPLSAIRGVQKAINHCGVHVDEDGILGTTTINAINSFQTESPWLLDRLKLEFILWYVSRVEKDATQIKFLVGWIRRVMT